MVSEKAKGQIPTSAVTPELRHQGVCLPFRRGSLRQAARQKSKNGKNLTENEIISGCLFCRQGIKEWEGLQFSICGAHVFLTSHIKCLCQIKPSGLGDEVSIVTHHQ